MKKTILCLLLLALTLGLLSGCGGSVGTTQITSIEQLNDPSRKIAVAFDTSEDRLVAQELPLAQMEYFSVDMNAYTEVAQGKLDAVIFSRRSMECAIRNGLTGVRLLDETLGEGSISAVALSPLSEIPQLEEKVNAFLQEVREDGTLDDMVERWLFQNDDTMPEIPVPQSSDLHLTVGTTGLSVPFTYYIGTELAGYDIELATRFAAWLGATLEFKIYDYGGIVAAAQTGDVDCIFANLFITPERAESIRFSDPTYHSEIGVMVRAAQENEAGSDFFTSIGQSFEKTFIRENRWKLFVDGIGTTVLITVLSILFGTALGFGVFLLCRKGNRIANAVTRFCIWLVQGMPMVVLLMILYYVVFGSLTISGTVVAVIAFTLVFGAAMFGMLQNGVGAVDRGQTEAAYALGYSDRRAFFRVVLPQALPHFFPAYKGEITAIIKATAIVGYIAVQDLTKMGDIVRSRTYEAFFPLIAVAIIYFVLAAVLTAGVNQLGKFIDPRMRKQPALLKEVNRRD